MAVFIFVARPVTVLACLLRDERGRWTREELAFLSWSRYTGVIPAAVASLLLARGVEGAEIAVSLGALAVVATLVLQATPLATWHGCSAPSRNRTKRSTRPRTPLLGLRENSNWLRFLGTYSRSSLLK